MTSTPTKKFCVYKLTFPNEKLYFGITTQFKQRMRSHAYWEHVLVTSSPIKNAIRKYGWTNIQRIILEEELDAETAYELEKKLIKDYRTQNFEFGYNLADGGRTALGCKHSTNAAKGRPLKEEHRLNLIKAKAGKSYSVIAGNNSTKYPVIATDLLTGEITRHKNASVFGREMGVPISVVYKHILRNSTRLYKRWQVRYLTN